MCRLIKAGGGKILDTLQDVDIPEVTHVLTETKYYPLIQVGRNEVHKQDSVEYGVGGGGRVGGFRVTQQFSSLLLASTPFLRQKVELFSFLDSLNLSVIYLIDCVE